MNKDLEGTVLVEADKTRAVVIIDENNDPRAIEDKITSDKYEEIRQEPYKSIRTNVEKIEKSIQIKYN